MTDIKSIPITDLFYDPENPRLPKSLHGKPDTAVINYMLRDENILELMVSIAQQGFFDGEPLLVVEFKIVDGIQKYTVVEGNRRLTAVKLLNNPSIASLRKKSVEDIVSSAGNIPRELPAVIYPSRVSVLEYLGYRHITGVKAWDSLAKARYMKSLFNSVSGESTREKFKEIAKIIGSKSNYVARILTGLIVYETIESNDFFDLKGVDADEIEFSLLTTALSFNSISSYIGIDSNQDFEDVNEVILPNLKNLTEWIYQEKEGSTRIGESRNLSKLAKVIANERALAAFSHQGKSLSEALLFTDDPKISFEKSLNAAYSGISAASSQFHLLESVDQNYIDTLNEVRSLTVQLRLLVQNKIDEMDDKA